MCFCFLFCFLSPLVWFVLWLPEEVLALLFLLHRENGDFSILMKDIYLFLYALPAYPITLTEILVSPGCILQW